MKSFFRNHTLAFSFLTAMLMVAFDVSLWASLFSGTFVFLKWFHEMKKGPIVPRKITGILSIILLPIVWMQFHTLVSQDAAYTYLLCLSALKIMDYQTERDHKFVILLGFILVAAKSLFSIDIYWLLPTFLAFAGLWISLLPQEFKYKSNFMIKIFLLSSPLALLLFFIFPRFALPWALSKGNFRGEMGFSDGINPGQIAELASQSQLVFRAKFPNNMKLRDLYWRGSILTDSAGLIWKSRHLQIAPEPQGLSLDKTKYYEVALEPISQQFLFVLEGTKGVQTDQERFLSLEGNIFRLTKSSTKTFVYRGLFDTRTGIEAETGPGTEIDPSYLKVPELSEGVQQFVSKILSKNQNQANRLNSLEEFFSQKGFAYTLRPGTYEGKNGFEEFLFRRKKGFCEHYAGAYATLARALGIPSRVVVGYQGGHYNPFGNFWSVTQKDAHAWVEIFWQGQWLRKDPTQWVAPLRFEIGAEDFFSLSLEDQFAFAKNLSWRPKKDDFKIFESLSTWLDTINYHWTYFLIDFDRGAQLEFLQLIQDFVKKYVALMIGISLLAGTFFLWKYRFTSQEHPLIKIYHTVEKWGAQQNLHRLNNEPPLVYLQRLEKTFPAKESFFKNLGHYLDMLLYQEKEFDSPKVKTLIQETKKILSNK